MEKLKTSKSKTTICPRCKGNGYFTVKESINNPADIVVQCPMCNSQGELNDPNDDIIITSSGVHKLQ
jgi:DnaJ-class molecular chaperone|tara:strand:- start:415 stop:615 length:201 start_codon:yes stop_codon:yes gene_type:complete